MFNRITTFILVSFFLINSGCDIFNGDDGSRDMPESIKISSSIAGSIEAVDVIHPPEGIFILGQARANGEDNNDFYIAKIDEKGNLLWEKMYGRATNERAFAMTSTSDDHLLLVGFSPSDNVNIDGDELFIAKVDYSGKLKWQNTYAFDADQGIAKFGENMGRSVIEVTDGYIIGGVGTKSQGQFGYTVPMLTKVNFEGEELWSIATSDNYGFINGLVLDKTTSKFTAVGFLNEADAVTFDMGADTVATSNFIDESETYRLVNLVNTGDTLIAPEEGGVN